MWQPGSLGAGAYGVVAVARHGHTRNARAAAAGRVGPPGPRAPRGGRRAAPGLQARRAGNRSMECAERAEQTAEYVDAMRAAMIAGKFDTERFSTGTRGN